MVERIFESVAVAEQAINPAWLCCPVAPLHPQPEWRRLPVWHWRPASTHPRYAHLHPIALRDATSPARRMPLGPWRIGSWIRARRLLLLKGAAVSVIDIETKTKLREMGAGELAVALEAQDDQLAASLAFGERIRLAVDDAYTGYTEAKVSGLLKRAGLRYPSADLRSLVPWWSSAGWTDPMSLSSPPAASSPPTATRVAGVHRIRQNLPRLSAAQGGLRSPLPGPRDPHARPC